MKNIFILSIFFFLGSCTQEQQEKLRQFLFQRNLKEANMPKDLMKNNRTIKTKLYSLSDQGAEKIVGSIDVSELSHGISISIHATNLAPGEHGIHIHENNNIKPYVNSDGQLVVGGMAGGHWDPDLTKNHKGPEGNGHKGDLPKIIVPESGILTIVLTSPVVQFSDINGKSIIIHAQGDNYSDSPNPQGGGGERMYGATF